MFVQRKEVRFVLVGLVANKLFCIHVGKMFKLSDEMGLIEDTAILGDTSQGQQIFVLYFLQQFLEAQDALIVFCCKPMNFVNSSIGFLGLP